MARLLHYLQVEPHTVICKNQVADTRLRYLLLQFDDFLAAPQMGKDISLH